MIKKKKKMTKNVMIVIMKITVAIMIMSYHLLFISPGTPDAWPFLILLEAIPATVSLLILPCLPETPRFTLLIKKDRDAARKGK